MPDGWRQPTDGHRIREQRGGGQLANNDGSDFVAGGRKWSKGYLLL